MIILVVLCSFFVCVWVWVVDRCCLLSLLYLVDWLAIDGARCGVGLISVN